MSEPRSWLNQSPGGNPPGGYEHAREAFVAAWQAGQRRSIESFLVEMPDSGQAGVFRELLTAELSLRRRAGEIPLLEEYQARFAQFRGIIESTFRESPTVHAVMAASPTPTISWQAERDAESFVPQIPGYEILQQLAPGGMGVVFRARDSAADQQVALKMIRSGIHADAQERARFRLESEAIASLVHPNILKIYSFGEWQGMPYLSMEFAAGGSLAQLLETGPLGFDRAAELLETLARAAQFIHDRDIIHRDLKPANILISADGTPKLADFGLAKRLDFDQGLTQTQAVLGTASYMAPEQAAGTRQGLGPAVDIYALGAILYELLTGVPPFLAETRELTIHQVLSKEPRRPTAIRSEVPAGLEAICLKCLEKRIEERFTTARALADELVRYRKAEPLSIRMGAFEHRRRAALHAGYELLEALEPEDECCLYRARHRALNRIDVLEIFRVQTTEPATLRARAELVSKIHHPHIVEMYAFGDLEGEWFIAREHVDGKSISDCWPSPMESPERAATIVELLARAVHHAHLQGLHHGNLQPAKIIVGAGEHCKITGFAREDSVATSVNVIADLNQLGELLYFLLYGQPVAATNVQGAPAPSNLDKRASIATELDAVCRKCFEREPSRCYPNAAALAEDLRRARAGEVLLIDDLDEWTQQVRWARRAGYRILELMGQTRDGFTYKAKHIGQDRLVVLKRISARHRFVPAAKERFRMQARLMESLRQPSIAQVYDQGEQNDLVYYAREYIQGVSLTVRIASVAGRLAASPGSDSGESTHIDAAIRLVRHLAEALDFVHSRNVVHGNLNPTCVCVTPDGVPKITSFRRFNVSNRPLDDDLAETDRQRLAWYVAPELRENKRQRAERSADIYSLGAILHALLTGPPQVEGFHPLDHVVSESIEGAAAAICRRCLSPRPSDRYPTIEDLLLACEGSDQT